MFYWEDYKSSGFDKSNLFLLRIANPQGRLAVDFLGRFAIRLSNRLFYSSHHSLLSESIFLGFYILEIKF